MTNTKRICKLLNCNEKSYSDGYCKKHYASFRYYKKKYNKNTLDYCKVENCNNFSINKDYCFYHNQKYINYNIKKSYNPKDFIIKCKIDNCSERFYAKGYCENHYRKLYIEFEKNDQLFSNKEVDCTLEKSIKNNV